MTIFNVITKFFSKPQKTEQQKKPIKLKKMNGLNMKMQNGVWIF